MRAEKPSVAPKLDSLTGTLAQILGNESTTGKTIPGQHIELRKMSQGHYQIIRTNFYSGTQLRFDILGDDIVNYEHYHKDNVTGDYIADKDTGKLKADSQMRSYLLDLLRNHFKPQGNR